MKSKTTQIKLETLYIIIIILNKINIYNISIFNKIYILGNFNRLHIT